MEKDGIASSNDDAKQEKYARNQCKFDQSKYKFDELTRTLNEQLDKVEGKVERVIVDLTLKFTKQVQFNLFKDMN